MARSVFETFSGPIDPRATLEAFSDPASSKYFEVDLAPHDLDAATHDATIIALATYMPYLFATRPKGCPLRANVPEVLERIRSRLRSPELLLSLGRVFVEDPEVFLTQVGGEEVSREQRDRNARPRTGRDNGTIVAINMRDVLGGDPVRWRVELWFRPNRVESYEAETALRKLATGRSFFVAELLASSTYSRFAERVRETPIGEGQFEANPLASVPKLVEQVRDVHRLGEDAAALYLQTLTLAAPTTKNVQLWNDWTSARYQKAAAELVARELVVEAKRERASRKHFLPGGWEALEAPDMPLETWKLPLYGLTRKGDALVKTLPAIVPLEPLHELFARAWDRIQKGERPRYEEVS
jgi:hypothetical protein